MAGDATYTMRQIGDATLYCGDSRELLRAGVFGPVASMVTDPPYALQNRFGKMRTNVGTRTLQFAFDDKDCTPSVVDCIAECAELVKNAVVVFCGAEQSGSIAPALRGKGMTAKHAVWVKPYPPPPGNGNWWPSAFENIVYGYRKNAYFGDDSHYRCNVFIADSLRYGRAEKNGHPTQKPLDLIRYLVRCVTPESGAVLDPYMGSGTTGVAALSLGRTFIGCEISPEFFEIACRRIELFYERGGAP